MRILIGLCLSLLIITPAWATETATAASKVFAAVSPSIVVVEAFDSSGHALALGSGVVIAKGVVVSSEGFPERDPLCRLAPTFQHWVTVVGNDTGQLGYLSSCTLNAHAGELIQRHTPGAALYAPLIDRSL